MKAVRRNLPEYDETQQVHMKKTKQGVQSTPVKYIVWGKNENSDTDTYESPKKQREIFVKTYFSKDNIYTNQTGKFPVWFRGVSK